MNQIFGYQILPEDASSNHFVFDETKLVSPSANFDSRPGQVQIFAQSNSHFQCCFSQKYRAYSYVWGIPAHPDISTSDIPKWCANAVVERRYGRFRELIGTFVVIIDEPEQNRITFVTDILGVRPMFHGKHNGRIVFGSNVWSIQRAGLTKGEIDYDAVSAWISYGYNCTDGTIFSDLRRLPPGSAVVLQDGQFTQIPYVAFESKSQAPEIEQVSEEVHHIVSSTIKPLLANHPRIIFSLSGGYDSRYLLALSLSLGKTSVECATVSYTEEEGHVAHQVAEILGVPLKTHNINGSIWNLYDKVYHFTADGFPISKFVTYCLAQQYPEIPMVNGFMGDSLIRGSKDTFLGKYETEWGYDLAEVLQRKHLFANFKLFRREVVERIQMRSRVPMEKAAQKGASIGKVFGWADFYYRQRFYISNNFLQHIEITETLLPFYSWKLLAYKMEHDYKLFNRDIYHVIFLTHFPQLAKIPHASDLPTKKYHHFGVAKCTNQWSRELFPIICNKEWLSLLRKKLCIPLDLAGIAGLRRAESSIFLLERLYLLEKRMRDVGLDFDWECI